MADDVPDVAWDLYQLPPAEFVAARDALVKRLRAEGDRETANEVKGLRRPSVAAGFLNALAHDHPDDLAALVELAANLAQAQEARVRGEDADVTGLSKARREAINDLTARSGAGGGPHAVVVASTLEAASADADLAAQVQSGVLTDVPEPGGGFGFGFGFALSDEADDEPAPRRQTSKKTKAKASKAKAKGSTTTDDESLATDEQARADEVAARRRQKAIDDAEAAEAEADALLADADQVDAEVERLRAELSAAESRAADASKAARQAATAARAARKKADRLSST